MPKLKTHKAAQRRFRTTSTGKILRSKIGKSHLRRNKSGRVKRGYAKAVLVHPSSKAKVRRLLPYG